jgi:hypothetical protein
MYSCPIFSSRVIFDNKESAQAWDSCINTTLFWAVLLFKNAKKRIEKQKDRIFWWGIGEIEIIYSKKTEKPASAYLNLQKISIPTYV